MSRFAIRNTSTALVLIGLASPAFAELTAQEVWDGIEQAMQSYGYTVSGDERATSNGLSVTDVSMVIELPEDSSRIAFEIPELSLAENRNGSVLMTFPDTMPIAISAKTEDGELVEMRLDYANTGLEMTVSGEARNLVYNYVADALSITLEEMSVNDRPVGRQEAQFRMAMSGIAGSANTLTGAGSQITQSVTAQEASYHFAFRDPDTEESGLMSGSVSGLSIDSATNLPEGFDSSDPSSLADSDFSAEGTMSYSGGELQFAADDGSGTNGGTISSESVSLSFGMDPTALNYEARVINQAFDMSGPEFPVPISVNMGESAFNVTVPIAAADAPQDVAFGMKFAGFEMSQLIWNMIDPGSALPRDPATIAIDLTGQATPFINLFDPASVTQLEQTGGMPGELNALTLNDLTIEAAGAKIGGSGSFTFDNSDLETFGGVPRPSGGVDLTVDGANGLIDKLIGMGLLTAEDAMGARMMMSMFAVPGDGPDSLKSSLEINDQGHVLANGMRIQ